MGDISIIARRLGDSNYVQYGWGSNEGYCRAVGLRLLQWYNTPEMAAYLFSLGQLRCLWEPGSEQSSREIRTLPTGRPHYLGASEQEIFSRIAFAEYGYFYDSDHQWYYVTPVPYCMKIPLTMVAGNLDGNGMEHAFLCRVEQAVLREITEHWYESSPEFRAHLEQFGYDKEAVRTLAEQPDDEERPILELMHRHKAIFRWFDGWLIVRPKADGVSIGEIVMKPKAEEHIETIRW